MAERAACEANQHRWGDWVILRQSLEAALGTSSLPASSSLVTLMRGCYDCPAHDLATAVIGK